MLPKPSSSALLDNGRFIGLSMKSLLLGIVVVSLALSILPYTSTTVEVDRNDRFLISHTLDPRVEIDRNYKSWGRTEWLVWLNRRQGLLDRTFYHPPRYWNRLLKKGLNTVVIATPLEITHTFQGNLQPYDERESTYWSNRRFPTYVVDKSGSTHKIFLCPPTYIAVGFRNGKPNHLPKFNTIRVTSSEGSNNYNYSSECVELT